MSEGALDWSSAEALADLHAAMDGLLGVGLTSDGDPDLLDRHRVLKRVRNKLAAPEHRLINEETSQGLSDQYGATHAPRRSGATTRCSS